jgi:hypothetical protein
MKTAFVYTIYKKPKKIKKQVENPGNDPGTSRMLSERSTI